MSNSPNRRQFLRAMGVLALGACASPAISVAAPAKIPRHSVTRPLMGTFVTVTVCHSSKTLAEEAIGLAFETMDNNMAVFDRFNPSSAISALNDAGKLAGPPPELSALMTRAGQVRSLTGGMFDVTVKPVVDLLRSADKGKKFKLSETELRRALALVNGKDITVTPKNITLGKDGMGVTLDSMAKGHIADRAAQTIVDAGITTYMINAGGDIRVSTQASGTPWKIGIQDPAGNGHSAVIAMRSGAIATSGGYESKFDVAGRHTHLVDPKTGNSPHTMASATVTASTVAEADALATATFLSGIKRGMDMVNALPGRECLMLTDQGAQLKSRGWAG